MDNKGCYYFYVHCGRKYRLFHNWHSSFALVTNLINASYVIISTAAATLEEEKGDEIQVKE